jgi:hypothetical protein
VELIKTTPPSNNLLSINNRFQQSKIPLGEEAYKETTKAVGQRIIMVSRLCGQKKGYSPPLLIIFHEPEFPFMLPTVRYFAGWSYNNRFTFGGNCPIG